MAARKKHRKKTTTSTTHRKKRRKKAHSATGSVKTQLDHVIKNLQAIKKHV